MAETEIKAPDPFVARIQGVVARIQKLKPVRVWMHYARAPRPDPRGGLAYQAIFSVFAALWAVFSVAGLVIGANPRCARPSST